MAGYCREDEEIKVKRDIFKQKSKDLQHWRYCQQKKYISKIICKLRLQIS